MIEQGIKHFVQRMFDIRKGETGRAVLMQLNIFLIITSLLVIKPTVNGLFVARFGAAGLPKAYVLVALTAVLIATVYAQLMSRFSLLRMIIGTFLLNVFVLGGFGFLLNQSVLPGWELYLIYVWVAVFGVFSASQFWILANLLFNAREAKRLFGFISAGAIIGGILGGYLTHLLAPVIGSENMIFVGAALLSLCIPITLFIWRRYLQNVRFQTREKKELRRSLDNPLTLISRSRHLTYMAVIIGVSVIVAKLVDFQYSDIAAAYYPEKDELTAFFGFWFSNFSILSLVFQLFLTRKLLSRLGIGGTLLFLPTGIFLGALALLFFPVLWAAVFLKAADSSLKQSVNKAAFELLNIPIPIHLKKRVKTFLDVVVDSFATGMGGLILIFLVRGLDLSTQAINLMIILLTATWGIFAYLVRKEYLKSFRVHLLHQKREKRQLDFRDKKVVENLLRVLESGAEQEKKWVLQQIRSMEKEEFFEPCRRLLTHSSAAVRKEALKVLHHYHHYNLKEEVWPLADDPDPGVRVAAFSYLLSFDSSRLTDIRDIILRDDLDYRVRGPVLVRMAEETNNNPALQEELGIESFVLERKNMIDEVKDPSEKRFRKKRLAEGIGKAHIAGLYPLLERLLQDEDPEVVRQAILAAGYTEDPYFISLIAGFLPQKATRSQAIEALVEYGPAVLLYLRNMVADPATDTEVIRWMTEVAERLETPESVKFLFELCDNEDQGVQIEALRSLTDLKRNFPEIRFSSKFLLERILDEAELYQETISILYAQQQKTSEQTALGLQPKVLEARQGLINLLEHRLQNHLERMVRLLGLKYSPDDFSMVFKSIKNQEKEIRANTLEFLENLLHPNLKGAVIPVLESAMNDSVSREVIEKLKIDVPDERECYEMLLDTNDLRVKFAIFYLIQQLDKPEYYALLKPFTDSSHPKVKEYASSVYNQMSRIKD